MSFQAYIDNIETKTGKSIGEIKDMIAAAELLQPDVKVTRIVNFLKDNLALGHGHAMAVVQWLKNEGLYPAP